MKFYFKCNRHLFHIGQLRKNIISALIVMVFSIVLPLSLVTTSYARDITLAWDANTDSIAGYKIYYRSGSSGNRVLANYDGSGAVEGPSPISVAKEDLVDPQNPEFTLTGLSDNESFFFVATAYDNAGLESGPSNEAAYDPAQRTLQVETTGSGIVTPSGGSYVAGSVVRLRALPDAGWVFIGWSGDVTGSTNPVYVTMDGDKSVTATFSEAPANENTLRVDTTGEGNVTPFCGSYVAGSVVQLSAQADAGWVFVGWSGDIVSFSNPVYVTMDGHKSVTATFSEAPPNEYYTLQVETRGGGSVTSFGGSYVSGSVVQLSAQADAGWVFVNWSGDVVSSSNPVEITMDADKSIAAIFNMAAPLVINSLTVTPDKIWQGDFAVLSWDISGADSAVIDHGVGAVNPISGSCEIAPELGTTYTLTASNEGGNISRSVFVKVMRLSEPEIIKTIPQDGAGIMDYTIVPVDSSFAVLVEAPYGIDLTDPNSISFTIDDGEAVYDVDLDESKDISLRITKLDQYHDDTSLSFFWAIYQTIEDDARGNSFPYGSEVRVTVDVEDAEGFYTEKDYSFRTETEQEHHEVIAKLPDTAPVNVSDPGLEPEKGYDAGIQVSSGDLDGAKIIYNSSEPIVPIFGPLDEPPSLEFVGTGHPISIMPPTVFVTPIKIFIPCPGYENVSGLGVYLYDGTNWIQACDADGNVLQGGEGWMVPGSLIDHNGSDLSYIEIKAYYSCGVQAGTDSSFVGAAYIGSTSAGGGGCFISVLTDGSFLERCANILRRFRYCFFMSDPDRQGRKDIPHYTLKNRLSKRAPK